jgi:hypothetical protein
MVRDVFAAVCNSSRNLGSKKKEYKNRKRRTAPTPYKQFSPYVSS